ncbi:FAD-dependent oxidoreductase [Nocardioides sp. GY 10127]|uniref:FAD-dependent oxidoreductase n=1 Tax=Nocardioides sp. GY 10127 TaxID=2569762 RepID=UPI0010A85E7C|nr:FAD-dependent oxidoreductase [Nocardioides sp. GY 10127]TIC82876.1 FAD-dependent oxidoreductase [Nocardioides sp. GY 10127]
MAAPRVAAPRRVAVVGSGVAGLTAAYVASRTAHVTLFEADDRLGGHADTHTVREGDRELGIDTGFIVHNRRTYPTLLRMFRELGVGTQPSEMSMSIRDDEAAVEWAGALGRSGLFPTSANARNPRFWRMLTEIPRFHRRAHALLEAGDQPGDQAGDQAGADQTLRAFLDEAGFSPFFVRQFMEPLVAAVWSCDPSVALDYPARYLFAFLRHHGMLSVFGSPTWRTVTGGSRSYVERIGAELTGPRGEVRTGTKVTGLREVTDGVQVTDGNGRTETFDAVVVAVHPHQALALLTEPTPAQREVLAAMPYSPNTALLHTDASLLPTAEGARASWNFLRPSADQARTDGGEGVVVTYDLTRLQRLDTDTRYLVTLGGEHLVDPASVIDRMEYEHPLYTPESVAAQRRLPELDSDRLAFAGAYHGWGFHEDGARSGLAAATRLGLTWPEPVPSAPAEAEPVPATPAVYRTSVTHTRRRPWKRTFTHASSLWLVDVDDLPDHRPLAFLKGTFEARDHLGDPARSLRENLVGFLATQDVTPDPAGRVLLATQPRTLGYCFNPISVFWCLDREDRVEAVVVEVHNTYGDVHAYLVDPDEQGRAHTDKAMYVSPFHGTQGRYELAVPLPGERLHVAVTLHSGETYPGTSSGATTDNPTDNPSGEAVFSASVTGTVDPRPTSPYRATGAALRDAALIRVHGTWLWLRRLPVRPRPTHHQEGVQA